MRHHIEPKNCFKYWIYESWKNLHNFQFIINKDSGLAKLLHWEELKLVVEFWKAEGANWLKVSLLSWYLVFVQTKQLVTNVIPALPWHLICSHFNYSFSPMYLMTSQQILNFSFCFLKKNFQANYAFSPSETWLFIGVCESNKIHFIKIYEALTDAPGLVLDVGESRTIRQTSFLLSRILPSVGGDRGKTMSKHKAR